MVFDYSATDFSTQKDFLDWIDDIEERSIFDTGVDVAIDESILTLVTTSSDFPEARLVVFARQLRPSESLSVDETRVKVNASPRYPQIYYDNKGIKNPYADDDFYNDDADVSSTESETASDIEYGPLGDIEVNVEDSYDSSDVSGTESDLPSDTASSDIMTSSDVASEASSDDASSDAVTEQTPSLTE